MCFFLKVSFILLKFTSIFTFKDPYFYLEFLYCYLPNTSFSLFCQLAKYCFNHKYKAIQTTEHVFRHFPKFCCIYEKNGEKNTKKFWRNLYLLSSLDKTVFTRTIAVNKSFMLIHPKINLPVLNLKLSPLRHPISTETK